MATQIPEEWVDEKTGHRVIRLSRREGDNLSWYFHNYPFVIDAGEGDKMVFRGQTAHGWQLFTVNLKTLALQQVTEFSSDDIKLSEVLGRKRREAFYRQGDVVHAVNVDDGTLRQVGVLPCRCRCSALLPANARQPMFPASQQGCARQCAGLSGGVHLFPSC